MTDGKEERQRERQRERRRERRKQEEERIRKVQLGVLAFAVAAMILAAFAVRNIIPGTVRTGTREAELSDTENYFRMAGPDSGGSIPADGPAEPGSGESMSADGPAGPGSEGSISATGSAGSGSEGSISATGSAGSDSGGNIPTAGTDETENGTDTPRNGQGNRMSTLRKTDDGYEIDIFQEPETGEDSMTGTGSEEAAGTAHKNVQAENILASMSLEEKAAQLFIITPEALTGVGQATAAGETTKEKLRQYPVGGLVYFSGNIQSEIQVKEMLSNIQQFGMECTGLPLFTCVDEEGGTVTRISGRGIMNVPYIDTMESVGLLGETAVHDAGAEIGEYLSDLGFNTDFAPVADVATNAANPVMGSRCFSSDPERAARMTAEFVKGMHEKGVFTTLKHFPGHGDTAQDSHTSSAVSYKTLEELRTCEFLPFASGIEAGTDFVMAGHISLPNVTGDMTPATLSRQMITEILRNELGYDGVVVTDAMNMAAVSDLYTSADAAVKAIQAGVDMILMPADFQTAYNGILNAVREGALTEQRIDDSLRRIIDLKLRKNPASE